MVEAARTYRRRRSGDLTEDLSLFALLLRAVGVPVPIAGVLRATRALATVSLDQRVDVHAALRCCMTASTEEGAVFDVVFPVFWSTYPPDVLDLPDDSGAHGDEGSGNGKFDRVGADVAGSGAGTAERSARRATYSRSRRDDKTVPIVRAYEKQIDDLARRLARALGASRSRRTRVGHTGELISLRDSLRHNLRFGEEMLELRRSRRLHDRARLVVFCDVSSSMQPFTPLFLTFVHSLTKIARSVESAIFNVETSFVTDVFRRKTLPEALAWLEGRSISLAGGTRTGHCLHAFNAELEARGLFRKGTTALILSDGWDVGDSELLDREMHRLRSHVGRLIWLDPHAAATGYRPQVRGLQVAWPYIDDYLDFSSVESLTELVARVEGKPRDLAPR
ncbi:hypothetical protein TH66_19330 [Carbonactinospora thermoautotrophica]|uniref:VWA containing CoxE family protein n=1 Tax=Carbonactinospora thermoautotrophica TaxID=1469144 RepID=A0A132N1S1_9ACTN|nr:VWA domain-containing protein [Carbonactinospora thermoautotrophica]KWW97679.1 hypothetical protein TH66_19330 [Carbonactinospora thermoautotrophica]KWX00914.1 VWA containing CoxE family protein [Carbonactinospora thermoautotrophica]KWX03946.1 hypothetical protein TR74_24550 [Carbonactinospora thermoautotrophica]